MTTEAKPLKAPFPYPGGKSRVADIVWQRLGNVDNYVEPFAGSLANLLKRPADHFAHGYRVETVNDANHYLVNFWRAVRNAPDEVAEFADWPVMEADLHARHKWLVRSEHAADWRQKMATDPEHYDAKMAGWWVWGQCCWIGGAWCVDHYTKTGGDSSHKVKMPMASGEYDIGRGVHASGTGGASNRKKMPRLDCEHGVNAETAGRPQLTDAFDIGRGVNASANRPDLGSGRWHGPGQGVLAGGVGGSTDWTQVPDLANTRTQYMTCDEEKRPVFPDGGLSRGVTNMRREWLTDWMRRLSDRLRLVRTCYGHWSRICDSDSTMTRLGLTGAFLDPPYPTKKADGSKSRDDSLYVNDRLQCLDALRDEVLAWCRKWTGPQVRIVVCGYEGDGYEALVSEGWTEQAWEAGGGYSNQRRGGKGKGDNAKRERLWFSPSCLAPGGNSTLFDACEGEP